MLARSPREAGTLRQIITDAKRETHWNLADLSVLSPQHDPYRLDTPAGHRHGRWFRDQVDQLVLPNVTIHLRGMHYRICVSGTVQKPDGLPYENTDQDWQYLVEVAAKCARWLGYVQFERIVDERNAPPEVFDDQNSFDEDEALELRVKAGDKITLPLGFDPLPRLRAYGGRQHVQPYRIVQIGEKVSLKAALLPIARMVGGELLLPTGEITDTMLYDMVMRADADPRPLVILYYSDFDPSGWQMPISVAHKVRALRDLYVSGLDYRVFPVALNIDQVRQHKLPSTPLKEKEKRGDDWRACWDNEQTEIDALAALKPELLREIALNAIKPFYDDTLAKRADAVWTGWHEQATEQFQRRPAYAEAREEIIRAAARTRAEIESLSELQDTWTNRLNDAIEDDPLDDPPEDDVEPILAPAPEPIACAGDDYPTHARKLIDRKQLDGEGSP